MDEGAKGERSEGQGSGLVSCPRVTRVKATSSGGLGSLVAGCLSQTTRRDAGRIALGWGHKALILPRLWAILGVSSLRASVSSPLK